MAKGKAQFAAVPTRAISDRELTDGEFRVLAAVTSFDRMSSVRGKGQGAWASHINMAALAGCNYARFSTAVSKLMRLGYLEREPRVTNRKQYTYRVIYTEADGLPNSKHQATDHVRATANNDANLVCREGAEEPRIVCREGQLSHSDNYEIISQYISLREGIDSVETGEIDSAKAARLTSRIARQDENGSTIPAELARFERAFKNGQITFVDQRKWADWFDDLLENYEEPDPTYHWAQRLAEMLDARLNLSAWERGEVQ